MARPYTLVCSPINVSATAISTSHSYASAGNVTLNGTTSFALAYIVLFTSGGNDSGITFTISGTDANGNVISETVTGGNPTAVTVNYYKTITSITNSAATASTLTVGIRATTLVAATICYPLNFYTQFGAELSAEVTGTVNYTVQQTFDPILSAGTANVVWQSISALTSKTGTLSAQASVGATGIRTLVNSYSNGATVPLQIIQFNSVRG